jgi:hypothetical protein
MRLEEETRDKIVRQLTWSVGIYALPVVLMFAWFYWTGQRPWVSSVVPAAQAPASLQTLRGFLHHYWLTLFVLALGIVEFSFGLYEARWTKNERLIDIVCFAAPHLITGPAIALFSTKALPYLLPGLRGQFSWVPFI